MEICGYCHSFYCGKCIEANESVDALDSSCDDANLRFEGDAQ